MLRNKKRHSKDEEWRYQVNEVEGCYLFCPDIIFIINLIVVSSSSGF